MTVPQYSPLIFTVASQNASKTAVQHFFQKWMQAMKGKTDSRFYPRTNSSALRMADEIGSRGVSLILNPPVGWPAKLDRSLGGASTAKDIIVRFTSFSWASFRSLDLV